VRSAFRQVKVIIITIKIVIIIITIIIIVVIVIVMIFQEHAPHLLLLGYSQASSAVGNDDADDVMMITYIHFPLFLVCTGEWVIGLTDLEQVDVITTSIINTIITIITIIIITTIPDGMCIITTNSQL